MSFIQLTLLNGSIISIQVGTIDVLEDFILDDTYHTIVHNKNHEPFKVLQSRLQILNLMKEAYV